MPRNVSVESLLHCRRHALVLIEHRAGSGSRFVERLFRAEYPDCFLTESQAVSNLMHQSIPGIHVSGRPLVDIAVERIGNALE
jgi:hypothetical protein